MSELKVNTIAAASEGQNLVLEGGAASEDGVTPAGVVTLPMGSMVGTTPLGDGGGFTLGTEQATTSGTSKIFSGIPAGVTMVSLMFFGVSYAASASDSYLIRLGDSQGLETDGYVSSSTFQSGQDFASTNGFGMELDEGDRALHGIMTFALENSANNTWVASGVMRAGTPRILFVGGSVSLTNGVLAQIQISGVTFDAGALNIMYQ